jgi:hypothetical protein
MDEVVSFLTGIGLSDYVTAIVEEGFDDIVTLCDITENDMESLNIKLGHRRKLQRAIAEKRGFPSSQPLVSRTFENTPSTSPRSALSNRPTCHCSGARACQASSSETLPSPQTHFGFQSHHLDDNFTRSQSHEDLACSTPHTNATSSTSTNSESVISTQSSGYKQKKPYRKRPKKDPNAPVPPLTAYQTFLGMMNQKEMHEKGLSFSDIAKVCSKKWMDLSKGTGHILSLCSNKF